MNASWFKPVREFVVDHWKDRIAPSGEDHSNKTDQELLDILDGALTVLVPIDNQGKSRIGQFNHGGQPELSRMRFYSAMKLLKIRGKQEQTREVLLRHLPDLQNQLTCHTAADSCPDRSHSHSE